MRTRIDRESPQDSISLTTVDPFGADICSIEGGSCHNLKKAFIGSYYEITEMFRDELKDNDQNLWMLNIFNTISGHIDVLLPVEKLVFDSKKKPLVVDFWYLFVVTEC